jgi:hypothetical protein
MAEVRMLNAYTKAWHLRAARRALADSELALALLAAAQSASRAAAGLHLL